MDKNKVPEFKVTEEILTAFVEAVNNESFVLSDIAVVIGIRQEEAMAYEVFNSGGD
jgi:hypothetical protein